jgi:hypothetical protein
VNDSLDIEASVECFVEDVWDGPRANEFPVWDKFVVLAEFGFCNLVGRNVYSSVYVWEFY